MDWLVDLPFITTVVLLERPAYDLNTFYEIEMKQVFIINGEVKNNKQQTD